MSVSGVWADDAPRSDPDWGVTGGYHDVHGRWCPTSPESRAAILASMGVEPDASPPRPPPVRVVRAGEALGLAAPAEIRLEEGGRRRAERALPADLPLGYHELWPDRGSGPIQLIVTPARCLAPPDRPAWGWAVQLYALRSAASWGMGDLGDLARLARWSRHELGADLLLLNPLDAVLPVLPQEPSPYSPSSRRFLNPLYLRIEDVPGAPEAASDLEPLATASRAVDRARPIDRDRVFRLKMTALEALWARWPAVDRRFDDYCAERGRALHDYAVFCTLAERFRAGWSTWPPALRHPASPAVAAWAQAAKDRVRFHQWLQWLSDGQLSQTAKVIGLVRDLPVGITPDGADAWAWQDLLATGMSIGAPPDAFNPAGQDWGLPPFVPHRLRDSGYGPFVETIRAAFRHAAGLRLDHVMGLFRLYWVPWAGARPRGAYVRYPADDLLGILALESHRAGALVVGEDLGTVEEEVRQTLAARRVLSYRVLWFETGPPARYPRLSLAAVSTHDLPTIAGVWTGADLAGQRRAGLPGDEVGARALRDRLRDATGAADDAPPGEVVRRAYEALAEAPSVLIAATLDDALVAPDRPNLPGTTTTQRANWAVPLPEPLEAIERHPLPRAVGRALARRARRGEPGDILGRGCS